MPSSVLDLIGWRTPGAYMMMALNLRSKGARWKERKKEEREERERERRTTEKNRDRLGG